MNSLLAVVALFFLVQSVASESRCGSSWADANSRCGTACPSNTDAECAPAGEHCFADLNPCSNPPPPTPTNTTTIGYWWWTWSSSTSAPSGCNMGIAFNGWADPNSALQDSAGVVNKLPQTKYISLGGGNSNGRFTASNLQSITNSINSGAFGSYGGIVYDVEEGDSGLASAFSSSFAAAKSRGMKVLVTVSHSAPYGISDAASLMRSFFPNSNIDYLSPQLYTSGEEGSNDYSTVAGVQWSEYASAKATVIPSIVRGSMYGDCQNTFASYGVTTTGYVQWAQV